MKGKQVNFFFTPEDLAECESRIRQVGPLVIFEYRSGSPAPQLLNSTAVPVMGKSVLTVCLARPDDLKRVIFDYVETQRYFTVNILRSPVVELSRCFFDGHLLRRGRLYYVHEYYSDTGALIKKDAVFLRWGKTILEAAVKGLPMDQQQKSYLGPDAERLRSWGTCAFVT